MKKISNLFLILLVMISVQSCQEKAETIEKKETTSPIITSPDNFSKFDLEQTDAITISWKAVTFKDEKLSTQFYDIILIPEDTEKMALLIGNISDLTYNINAKELNSFINSAGYHTGSPLNFQLMISAKFSDISSVKDVSSENISIKITSYDDTIQPDKWTIIGPAVGGWELTNDKELQYIAIQDYYTLTLEMSAGEFKFRAPEKDSENTWSFNLGATGDIDPVQIENGQNINLISRGKNFEVTAGYYQIDLDVKNNKFSILKIGENPTNAWYNISFDAVGTGISSDNEKALEDNIWNFGNKLRDEYGMGLLMDNGLAEWYWYDIILIENEGFKLRAFNSENELFVNAGYTDILTRYSTENIKTDDKYNNIIMTKSGHYTIRLIVEENGGIGSFITINEKE